VRPIEKLDLLASGACVTGEGEGQCVFARFIAVACRALLALGGCGLEDHIEQAREFGWPRDPVARLRIA
jgi:hypothetical protein